MAKKEKERKEKSKKGFFKSIREEMKKVKWPTFKEILKYTIATIVFCLIIIAFFQVLDLLISIVKGLFN